MSEQQTDWRRSKIGELLTEHSERSTSSNQYEVLSVTKDGIFSQREYFKKQIASEDNSGYKVVRKGDVVFSAMNLWMGSIDVVKDQETGIVSPAYITMRPTEGLVDTGFLGYFLRGDEMRKKYVQHSQQGASIVRRNLNKDDLLDDEVYIPPLAEQKKITEILSGIDKCIAGTRTIKERIRATSKAIQDEFVLATVSGRTEHSFADLGSIADIRGRIGWKGYTKEDLVDSGALVLGGTQISKDNQIDLSKPVFISDFKYRESPEIMVNPGDLVLVKTGNTIGKIALVPDWNQEATINPNTVIIRARYPLNQYLLFALSSEYYQRKLWDLVAVGAQPSVNQANLKAIAIPIPGEKEIIALCEQFASLNRMQRTTEAKAVKLEYLKNAVSSDLLSGRKRVGV